MYFEYQWFHEFFWSLFILLSYQCMFKWFIFGYLFIVKWLIITSSIKWRQQQYNKIQFLIIYILVAVQVTIINIMINICPPCNM